MKFFLRFLPIFILTVLVILFFLPLFWPISQIFVTPDAQLSDILHLNYPLKYLLSQSLKQNQLPLWTDLIGTGFPLIGEGQIQALSPVNLLLFKCFPLITAFNLQYVLIFLGLILGMYFVAREFRWSPLTALFCAIIYAFSGLHIAKIPHLNNLQALSYVPFIFLIVLKIQKNKQSKLWLLLPVLLSQQLLQGHVQYVFMTVLFIGLYGFVNWWIPKKNDRIWILKKVVLIGSMALGLAAIQLIPTLEYFIKSNGRAGLSGDLLGSMTLSHLLQFFSPYILGDPRAGTYPAKYAIGFHETFSYIGVIPILLTLSSFFYVRSNTWVRNLWLLIGIFFLIAFEKNSPIYFLFSFPPFSWFHVQSRFLACITFLLVLLSGYIYEKIQNTLAEKRRQKKYTLGLYLLIISIFTISIFDVLHFAYLYHPKLPVTDVDSLPELYKNIPNDYRMTSIPYENTTWFQYMYTSGWKNPEDYIYLLNGGQPNYTVMHTIPNFSIYSGFLTGKQQQILSLALSTSEWNDTTKVATLSALALNTLRLQNTKYIFSTLTLANTDIKQIAQVNSPKNNLNPIYVSELSQVKPLYYLTNRYKPIHFIDEYIEEANKPDALMTSDAFLTTDKMLIPTSDKGAVTVISDKPTEKVFTLTTTSDMFFVASIYLYPGWEATLDKKKTQTIPSNLSGMAVFIPKGNHTLTLRFVPKSLYIGFGISVLTFILYVWGIIRSLFRTPS